MAKKKTPHKTGYQSDCCDEEWAFCAPYLTLMKEDAPQREHPLRKVFDALRYMVRAGCPWRMIPNDLPPWHTVYDQAQRSIAGGVFETIAHDLRKMLRLLPDTAPGAPAQLYDLAADPGEKTNLFFKHPEIVKELKALLDQSKTTGRSRP